MEEWVNLGSLGFPDYAISSYGQVRSERTAGLLSLSTNQVGVRKVGLIKAGSHERITLSVSRLVAHVFVPGENAIFNTPINLDGDRYNNRADNLLWRPRWFAVKYMQQLRIRPFHFSRPLELPETGEVFPDARAAAIKYGLLEMEIVRKLRTAEGVFPYGFVFKS